MRPHVIFAFSCELSALQKAHAEPPSTAFLAMRASRYQRIPHTRGGEPALMLAAGVAIWHSPHT